MRILFAVCVRENDYLLSWPMIIRLKHRDGLGTKRNSKFGKLMTHIPHTLNMFTCVRRIDGCA